MKAFNSSDKFTVKKIEDAQRERERLESEGDEFIKENKFDYALDSYRKALGLTMLGSKGLIVKIFNEKIDLENRRRIEEKIELIMS